jgi:hypothetical protein
LKWFFEDIPRPDFDDVLLLSGDERFRRLYDALHDDAYRRTSPGKLCRKFGISLSDLFEMWRQHVLCLGRILQSYHLPDIMQDVAEDSLSRDEPCPRCDGSGTVMDGVTERKCPACDGIGRIRVPGDAHARRLMLETLGLIRPKRGRSRAT